MTARPFRRVILGAALAAAALAVWPAAGQTPPAPPAGPAPGAPPLEAPPPAPGVMALPPPLAAGPAADLDLVFTAQVAGWLEPCG